MTLRDLADDDLMDLQLQVRMEVERRQEVGGIPTQITSLAERYEFLQGEPLDVSGMLAPTVPGAETEGEG